MRYFFIIFFFSERPESHAIIYNDSRSNSRDPMRRLPMDASRRIFVYVGESERKRP